VLTAAIGFGDKKPDNGEYGIPAVDGRRYPEQCPNCGVAVS
jgi:hypothetical protein